MSIFHERFSILASIIGALLLVGCVAMQETWQGSVAIVKEKMGQPSQDASTSTKNANDQSPEAFLDAEIETPRFSTVWRGMDELVTDYEDVLADNDKSWFGRRTRHLTNSALKLIATKAGIESYEKILDLQKKTQEMETEKGSLMAGRLGYPVTSMNPMAMTREKCDKKIQELQDDINACNIAIKQQSYLLLQDLNRHGQVINAKHLKYLLTAAGGDDVMQMMNLAIILKQVQYAIGKQINASTQFNGAQLQRYVGIQLVLLLAYKQAHVIAQENIREKYLPRLGDIQKQAETNLQETRTLQSTSQDGSSFLEQNIRISENTIQIATQYRTALQEMAKSLDNSQSKLDRNIAVTRNTFKTVTTGASLLKLIQESSQDYSELINFNPPILETIYSDQMMEAFQQVSAQLKK